MADQLRYLENGYRSAAEVRDDDDVVMTTG